MDQLDNNSEINMDQLDKDFQIFMDSLVEEGAIRKVIVDGVSLYFTDSDPKYKEYLALKEKENSENRSRYA